MEIVAMWKFGRRFSPKQQEQRDDFKRRYPMDFRPESLPYPVFCRFIELASAHYRFCDCSVLPCRLFHDIVKQVYTAKIEYDHQKKEFVMQEKGTGEDDYDQCIKSLNKLEGMNIRCLDVYGGPKTKDPNFICRNSQPSVDCNMFTFSLDTFPLMKSVKVWGHLWLTGCRITHDIFEIFKFPNLECVSLENVTIDPPMKLSHFLAKLKKIEGLTLYGCNFIVDEDDLDFISTWNPKHLRDTSLGVFEGRDDLLRRFFLPFYLNNYKTQKRVTFSVQNLGENGFYEEESYLCHAFMNWVRKNTKIDPTILVETVADNITENEICLQFEHGDDWVGAPKEKKKKKIQFHRRHGRRFMR